MSKVIPAAPSKVWTFDAADLKNFEWLIAPLSFQEFHDSFYEKNVCRIIRKDPTYYHKLLSLKALNELFYNQELTFPKTKLVNSKDESILDAGKYTINQKNINAAKLLQFYHEGYTIALSGLHDHIAELGFFVDQMVKFFNHKFQTNSYFTPPNSQGFKIHYDTHDVFVLQVEGSKRWRIYENSFPLAQKSQPFDKSDVKPGEIKEEFILNAGDMLYIPRGTYHDASSTDDYSLHITAGLLGYTWSEFLVESILHLSKTNVEFRKNLPIGFGMNPDVNEGKDIVNSIIDVIKHKMDVSQTYNRFYNELLEYKTPNIKDQLKQILDLNNISINDTVRRNENIVYDVDETEDEKLITVFGQQIKLPIFTKEAVDYILANKEFKINELPDCMDESGKVTLVKRLIKEGLLQRTL